MASVHHTVELGLNACGVECCPHAEHRDLVAVASYLHRPGDDDEPQSRVGQLYLYALAPRREDAAAEETPEETSASPRAREWSFAPAAPPSETRAIFELRWAPSAWTDPSGPVLAQADAGGFLTLYRVHRDEANEANEADGDDRGHRNGHDKGDGSRAVAREMTRLACGGGGLGMTTCADWNPSVSSAFGDGALATVGADGGLRVVAARESGELEITDETDAAHDLEAWAVAFARDEGGRVLATGADDAAFKGWDVRAGLDAPVFVNRRAHAAGVTCVAPSPHDARLIATGSYDDRVRLWDVRNLARPTETCSAADCGGGAWRLRWHPSERRVAVAAMGGGVSVLDWTGRRETATDEERDGEMVPGEWIASRVYEGHGSIAYGADWGWRGGGEDDVVVSCSFYDKGLHVWSPRVVR
jgi:diphthamide biosynthesis protein 7